MGILISVTARPEDIKFGQAVAALAGMEAAHVDRANELRKLIKDKKDVVIFWDVDHPDAIEISSPLSISNVGQVLRGVIDSARVFAISTQALNQTPFIFNIPIFNHHIYRQFDEPSPLLVSLLVKACRNRDPFGLQNYTPKGTEPRKIVLKNSKERRPVCEAIANILVKAAIPDQLNNLATQAVDEMLMNAIFDAPVRGTETYKRKLDRASEFNLAGRETVEVEFANVTGYFAICVRDSFGSLKKDSVLQYIRKDYEKSEYKVSDKDPGAGLGVYGMIQSGLSIVFCSRQNIKTEVMLFLPQVTGMKGFRKGFRFFSFI